MCTYVLLEKQQQTLNKSISSDIKKAQMIIWKDLISVVYCINDCPNRILFISISGFCFVFMKMPYLPLSVYTDRGY